MARKTIEKSGSDRLTQASVEAAQILAGDLAACSRMMRFYLDAAHQTDDEDDRAEFARNAAELAAAVAKLSGALAQIRGETRHRIETARVSDTAEETPEAPATAP